MVTFGDVARVALALPEAVETTSYGNVSWAVRTGRTRRGAPETKGFVWERPLSKKDRRQLTEAGGAQSGDEAEADVPPDEVILAARVEDLAEKEAILAENPGVAFTTAHFDGYPTVLFRIDRMHEPLLEEIVTSAWLAVAPTALADQLIRRRRQPRRSPSSPS